MGSGGMLAKKKGAFHICKRGLLPRFRAKIIIFYDIGKSFSLSGSNVYWPIAWNEIEGGEVAFERKMHYLCNRICCFADIGMSGCVISKELKDIRNG